MQIDVYAKNIELTPAIRSFVEEKVGSLARFLEGSSENLQARVEVGKPSRHHKSGQVFYAEINLKIGGHLLRAQAEHFDLYVAVDQVRDEAERQIKKFKGKLADKVRRGKVRVDLEVGPPNSGNP